MRPMVEKNVRDFINMSLISIYSFGRWKFHITYHQVDSRGQESSCGNNILMTVQIQPRKQGQQCGISMANSYQLTHQAHNQIYLTNYVPALQHLLLHLFLPVSQIIYFCF